ncbi:hypothetical protein NHP190003_13540 [Helicobacter sp. NHP19-003]|uniref:Uncharacterized protein n=1 Tax=Helicobacter gastrocanis TaxID=2849641 RepID=A0ABM7SCE8_9HELI|nr:hypothetical protein [Helicobacter sp. NHP19-003]BCZ18072.1 hypothetical protein NHP190003_13540 [Helicobacter sp. NHP19-003]
MASMEAHKKAVKMANLARKEARLGHIRQQILALAKNCRPQGHKGARPKSDSKSAWNGARLKTNTPV